MVVFQANLKAVSILQSVKFLHVNNLPPYSIVMPSPRAGALTDDARLTSVCRVHRA